MSRGFPAPMIAWLRCRHDGGTLLPPARLPERIVYGVLRCSTCAREYPIEEGIVRLLDAGTLDAESSQERLCRDRYAREAGDAREPSAWDRMEIDPTLAACEPLDGACVLELGAGTGRHTLPMASRGAAVLAVDFSAASLRQLAARMPPDREIGLVQADCTQLAVEPRRFDRVVSTLMSNLPTLHHRAAIMRAAALACRPGGRFVFGTHHYGIRSIVMREVRSGCYDGAPIYRYLFRPGEIVSETRRYFDEVACHPIQIRIPFAARLGLPILTLSRATERVPLINELGELLLVVARSPIPHVAPLERRDTPMGIPAGGAADDHNGVARRISRLSRHLPLRGHPFTQRR